MIEETYNIPESWFLLLYMVLPYFLSDRFYKTERKWLYFKTDFDVSVQFHVFLSVKLTTFPYLEVFCCHLKLTISEEMIIVDHTV